MEQATGGTYYPLMLKLQNRPCLVIGGGAVATRKVEALIAGGANCITVISPLLTEPLLLRWKDGKIQWIERQFRTDDLKSAFLIFAATNDAQINKQIGQLADECGILVNVANEGELGSFITPSTVQERGLIISISASGLSPSFVKVLKDDIKKRYIIPYSKYMEPLRLLRELVFRNHTSKVTRQQMLEIAARDCLNHEEVKDPKSWYDHIMKQLWFENNDKK